MRVPRSASQVLFHYLPEQTVDADFSVWKVRRWNSPIIESGVDVTALRDELIRSASPWSESGKDGGFVLDLRRQRPIIVKKLNRDDGVWCEPFPRLYLCRHCSRLHDTRSGICQCGSKARRGQLPFVGYHDECGGIKTPYVKKCPTHHERAVRFPGTASAAELIFYCPTCNRVIQRGFGAACDCEQGGALSFTVHRSGLVFKGRGVVVINPPRREVLNEIETSGGGPRALDWILSGMRERNMTEARASNDPASIRALLRARGFDESVIETMIAAMPATDRPDHSVANIPTEVRQEAAIQARQVALAMFESRHTVPDLRAGTTSAKLTDLYARAYPRALSAAGLERVEFVDRFPVLTAQYGYTRGATAPGAARLRTYRETNGDYVLYGELALTEALFVRLQPLDIHRWLRMSGFNVPNAEDNLQAAVRILESVQMTAGAGSLSQLLRTLIHSYAHAMIRRASLYAGIERSSLCELVLPYTFGFFIYAPAKGDFVLGGLQALFESELHELLEQLVTDDQRCALDPGCHDSGGACAVCLHLGEPSCRLFNTSLSRNVLSGGSGYFDVLFSRPNEVAAADQAIPRL